MAEWNVIYLESIDSTNTYLDNLAREGAPHGTVVVADSQTAGRGRFRRQWYSPPQRNVYMSILLRPEKVTPTVTSPLAELSVIPLLAGIACARAIREFCGLEVFLKWPNDIILNEKKLGGILVESRILRGGATVTSPPSEVSAYLIVGIGINVNMREEELPDEIRGIATSLYMETKKTFSRKELTDILIRQFFSLYEEFLKKGKAFVISEWQSLSSTIGRKIKAVLPDSREVYGRAIALNEDGYLVVLKSDGGLEIIRTADVTHLSATPSLLLHH